MAKLILVFLVLSLSLSLRPALHTGFSDSDAASSSSDSDSRAQCGLGHHIDAKDTQKLRRQYLRSMRRTNMWGDMKRFDWGGGSDDSSDADSFTFIGSDHKESPPRKKKKHRRPRYNVTSDAITAWLQALYGAVAFGVSRRKVDRLMRASIDHLQPLLRRLEPTITLPGSSETLKNFARDRDNDRHVDTSSFTRIDFCGRGHILYRGKYAFATACPDCGEKRYDCRGRPTNFFYFRHIRHHLLALLKTFPELMRARPVDSSDTIGSIRGGKLWERFKRVAGPGEFNQVLAGN